MGKKILMLLAFSILSGCTIEEVQQSGSPCSPTLSSDGFFRIGTISCYSDHMTGDCIDIDGRCIRTDECAGCLPEYRECLRYQADFDKLAANAESSDRRYVTRVNGSEDLSSYKSLFTSGNLNKCPDKSPYCVWEPDGDALSFGCIECSKTVCGSKCIDIEVTPEHCGACGHACPDGALCRDGECVCAAGEIVCDGKCVNPGSDMGHCGAHDSCEGDEAGQTCAAYQVCKDGTCVNGGTDGEVVCETGQHPYYTASGGVCEDDSIENCGMHGISCSGSGWKDGICDAGKCAASECISGYHVTDGQCIPDSTQCCGESCEQCTDGMVCSDGRCGLTCAAGQVLCSRKDGIKYCANLNAHVEDCGGCGNVCKIDNVPNSTEVECVNAVCIAKQCAEGYYLKDKKCIAYDADNCGAPGFRCSTSAGWINGTCTNGVCAAETCADGYHIRDGKCEYDSNDCCGFACEKCDQLMVCGGGKCQSSCGDQVLCEDKDGNKMCASLEFDPRNCGACGKICDKTSIPNSIEVKCEDSRCNVVLCESGYHISNNACVPDSVENCGGDGNVCRVEHAENACVSGKCTFKCLSGYHKDGAACAQDSITACGESRYNCRNAAGWKSGKCENGQCVVESCIDGHHIDKKEKKCVHDTDECCGAECVSCLASKMVCSGGECLKNCNLGETLCKNSGKQVCANLMMSNDHCGECGKSCLAANFDHAVTAKCDAGTCKPTSCIDNYHTDGLQCEKDSINHCGESGKICEVENAENECHLGACSFTCNPGFHRYGEKTCVPDDDEHCGSHTKSCKIDNGTGKCINGKCFASCSIGYHPSIDGSDCIVDDNSNCSGKKCNVANAENTCDKGICKFTCNTGYHESGNTCVIDTNYACGEKLKNCLNAVSNAIETECKDGDCRAITCKTGYNLIGGRCMKPLSPSLCPVNTVDCFKDGTKCCPSESACHENGSLQQCFMKTPVPLM